MSEYLHRFQELLCTFSSLRVINHDVSTVSMLLLYHDALLHIQHCITDPLPPVAALASNQTT